MPRGSPFRIDFLLALERGAHPVALVGIFIDVRRPFRFKRWYIQTRYYGNWSNEYESLPDRPMLGFILRLCQTLFRRGF